MKKAYFLFAAYLPKKAYFLFAAYFHEEGLLFICHNDHDLAGSSSRPGASDYISTLVRSIHLLHDLDILVCGGPQALK